MEGPSQKIKKCVCEGLHKRHVCVQMII